MTRVTSRHGWTTARRRRDPPEGRRRRSLVRGGYARTSLVCPADDPARCDLSRHPIGEDGEGAPAVTQSRLSVPAAIVDTVIETAGVDAIQAVRDVLRTKAQTRAALEVPHLGDFGLFPPAGPFSGEVRPVVVDANWFRNDVFRVCRYGGPTVLLTCAAENFLRPFVAPHVMLEVEEHAEEWSTEGRVDVGQFLDVWRQYYQPLLRVAQPDPQLLTYDEHGRIEVLRAVDPDDTPSVTLALLLRAPYVSSDRRAVRAVYGARRQGRGPEQLLNLLASGGTSGQLTELGAAGAMGTALAGMGAWQLMRFATRWPVLSLAAAGSAVMLGYSLRDRWKQPVMQAARVAAELYTAAVTLSQEAHAVLDAETPASPPWEELARELPRRSVIARAAVHELARYGPGHMSARELAIRLPRELGGVSDTTVRAQLRRLAPATLNEVFQGRWQVGRPWTDSPT